MFTFFMLVFLSCILNIALLYKQNCSVSTFRLNIACVVCFSVYAYNRLQIIYICICISFKATFKVAFQNTLFKSFIDCLKNVSNFCGYLVLYPDFFRGT